MDIGLYLKRYHGEIEVYQDDHADSRDYYASDDERINPSCCVGAFWRRDYEAGDRVCTGCGRCVMDNMVQSYRVGVRMGSQYATVYHLHERFTMVNLVDSSIPLGEFTLIKDCVRDSIRRGFPVRDRWDVQRILRKINKRFCTQQFTKKWLERWIQILYRTQGFTPCKISRAEIQKVDKLWGYARNAWIHCKPGNRRHVPNVSYILVQLLALIGRPPSETIHWFPQLKTTSILKKTEAYWFEICRYNNWPFISVIAQLQLFRRNKIRVD